MGHQGRPGGVKEYRSATGDAACHGQASEAERERRAKVIHAEGEFQASQKLADAAVVIARQPTAMHLRLLQSLVEVAAEK